MDYTPLLDSEDDDEDDVIFASMGLVPSSRGVLEAAQQSSPRRHPLPSSVFALSDSDSDDPTSTADAKPIQPQ